MEDKSNLLEGAQNKLEWIQKRVPLDTMQEEYVGFMLNQQEQMITLLSAHLHACRGCLFTGDMVSLEKFLDKVIGDMKVNEKKKPADSFKDCKYCDPAQGRNLCVNNRKYVTRLSRRKKCKEICIYFDKK
jgi:hypothetical protein